ncbi:MAG: hypothetical protein V1912_08320 [bacterium]
MINAQMMDSVGHKVRRLLDQGVVVHCPGTVDAADSLDPGRIAPGVVIHAGCRLRGANTSIGPGSVIGEEAPATIDDCQLGRGVSLKGGYFSESTFLDGSSVGSCAHVRPGTLLEEGASAAHAVGFKQTVLFPFVTVGSLVNLCDCLVSGGTGRADHSEIGSSYIHFNFTPHQDKATASLLGDVPRGVMLDRPPIFLGGQGGLVGPARLAFGTVVAAGVTCRQDILEENQLFAGRAVGGGGTRAYSNGVYVGIERLMSNNLHYIGNIRALQAWYQLVRKPLMTGVPCQEACYAGATARLALIFEERVTRLGEVAARMAGALTQSETGKRPSPGAAAVRSYAELVDSWPAVEARLRAGTPDAIGEREREAFLDEWRGIPSLTPYPEAVASLSPAGRAAGSTWLQALVDEVAVGAYEIYSGPRGSAAGA